MPALTLEHCLAALLFPLIAGFAWTVGARLATKLLG